MNKLIEGVDYYIENGLFIMTESFHQKRGFCCGNGCRHCAFEPVHIKNNTNLKKEESKKDEKRLDF
jgi:hypothetical protein